MKKEVLRMEYIGKNYHYTSRNSISLSVYDGEAFAIITEDIETKLFLLDVLQGNLRPTQGALYLYDKACTFFSPDSARNHGIYYASDSQLIFSMNVAHNLFLTQDCFYNKYTILNKKAILKAASKLLSEFSLEHIKPSATVASLSPVDRFLISILRAVALRAKIIILDNTFYSIYPPEEIEKIQHAVTILKQRKITVLWFSNRWDNLFQIFDRYAIIQNGVVVKVAPVSFIHSNSSTNDFLVTTTRHTFSFSKEGSPVFECRNYPHAKQNKIKYLNFSLYKREVLGICDSNNVLGPIFISFVQKQSLKENFFFLNGHPYHSKDHQRGIAVIYNHENHNSRIFPHMNLFDNITLLLDKPIYNKIGFMNKRIRNHIAATALKSIHAEYLIPKYKACANLLDSNLQDQLVIEITKWLCLKPHLFVFINLYDAYENFPEHEFKYLLDTLCNLDISVIVISASRETLTKLCTRIIHMES